MNKVLIAFSLVFFTMNNSCVTYKSDKELERQIKAEKDRYYSNFKVTKKY